MIYLDDGSEEDGGKMGGHIPNLQFDGAVRESKLLWVLGNYSRFIRPDMVRVQCEIFPEQSPENGLLVSAYKDLKNGRLVHVLTNLSEQAIIVNMGGSDDVKSYTTDKNSDMEYSTQKSNRIEVPERSVVTIVR